MQLPDHLILQLFIDSETLDVINLPFKNFNKTLNHKCKENNSDY